MQTSPISFASRGKAKEIGDVCTQATAEWSADYFDIVVTKFMINNRTDVLKTDVHLFLTITTGQNVQTWGNAW